MRRIFLALSLMLAVACRRHVEPAPMPAQPPAAPLGANGLPNSVTPLLFSGLSTAYALGSHDSRMIDGYSVAGDGGGGHFVWNATSTATPDSCTIVQATGVTTGRWVRVISDSASFRAQWCGGASNANYYSPSSHKWFSDAGLTTEATDYAVIVARALTAVLASFPANDAGLVQPTIILPAGNLYFKTKQTTYTSGSVGNEFVRWASGVSLRGAGQNATIIRIAPGLDTAGAKGYSTVFGIYDQTTPTKLNNVEFSDFSVDHNAAGNQWPGANFNSQPNSEIANSAINFIGGGTNVHIHDLTDLNFNGVFAIEAGNYATVSTTTAVTIEHVTVRNPGHDVNQGDNSVIAGGLTSSSVLASQVIDDNPAGSNSTNSCFEIHGVSDRFIGNHCNVGSVGLTSAGDSANGSAFVISNNHFQTAICIELLSEFYNNVAGYLINGNFCGPNGTAGVALEQGPQPGIFSNIEITSNYFTGGYNLGGIYVVAAAGMSNPADGGTSIGLGGISVKHNKFWNCGVNPAIVVAPPFNEQVTDMSIVGNEIDSCSGSSFPGYAGILISGAADAGIVQHKRLFVSDNHVSDNRDAGVTQYGVLVTGWTDNTDIIDMGQPTTNVGAAPVLVCTNSANGCYPQATTGYVSETYNALTVNGDAAIGGAATVTGTLTTAAGQVWKTANLVNTTSAGVGAFDVIGINDNAATSVTAPVPAQGRHFLIADTGNNANTNNITIHQNGTEHFNPGNTTTFVINTNGQSVEFMCVDGTNWQAVWTYP